MYTKRRQGQTGGQFHFLYNYKIGSACIANHLKTVLCSLANKDQTGFTANRFIGLLFIEGLYCYSTANHTGSPQGLYKTCTLHKHKTYKHNPKVSPFGIALIKKGNKVRPPQKDRPGRHCHGGNDDQTPEHGLQACPLFDDQRKDVWPDETDLETKLWGTADNLCLTTRFTTSIGLQI